MIDATGVAVVDRDRVGQVEVGGVNSAVDLEATMHADLDLLCITVYCTADDLLPEPSRNARRKLTDAEIVTLCVAQVLIGIPSDRRFLRAARRQLSHLFPLLPSQDALHKRRQRLRVRRAEPLLPGRS